MSRGTATTLKETVKPNLKRKDLLERLSYQLGRELSARTIMFHSVMAEKMGLSITEHKALDLLSRQGPITAGQLAEVTGLTTGAITGMVDRLEKGGFVRRVPDPHDRRKVRIETVVEKYEAMGSVFESLGQAMNDLLKSYDDKELAVIYDFMSRLPDVMETETKKLKEGSSVLKEV
jgi:DNA-binding MarR family transcriptional regulator